MKLNAKIPPGPLQHKWDHYCATTRLVSPKNKQKYHVLVVGSGLAGASAAASLAELGFVVSCFCLQDSPRRAHSIAAQGGINAAKNYRNDGDNVHRLFYDTIKGGDFRSREANVYRLAQLSLPIIDHCVAQGVPFARDYGGMLDNRSFGGALVSRTFYARGQTGQQLLLGAYGALCRQIGLGRVTMHVNCEMQDLIVIDGQARGIVVRNLRNGEVHAHTGHAVVLATGGYAPVFYLSTNGLGCNVTATYRAFQRGADFANPCFTQIHPTCIPVSGEGQSKLTLMSESLRNDGRVWVPKEQGVTRQPNAIPQNERDYYLERRYPRYGNLAPRDIASRAAKQVCDEGRGVGDSQRGVYLDFADAIATLGHNTISSRYGNLFEMYERITGEDPYHTPMRIYPAAHYTMGGLWVDYELMSTIPGLFVLGEANFSDHGANRLGASALMQALSDGYFVLPATIGNYLTDLPLNDNVQDAAEVKQTRQDVCDRLRWMSQVGGKRSPTWFHKKLGEIMWNCCGMSRNEKGLKQALSDLTALQEEFWKDVCVPTEIDFNPTLDKACRVADLLQFAQVICLDALHRKESCGAHFRCEFQTPEGEAARQDAEFSHVALWQFQQDQAATRYTEELTFAEAKPTERSYK